MKKTDPSPSIGSPIFILSKKRLGYIGFAPVTAVALLLILFGQMSALPQAAPTAPTTRYVTDSGAGDCTELNPCPLQEAVDQSINGDTVLVAGGVYDVGAPILKITQTITVSGGFDSNNWATPPKPEQNLTILDGRGATQVVNISGAASPIIEGFIIQNGFAPFGGGIRNTNGTPLIQNNIIRNNSATNGGGIYDEKSATILSNQIHNNQAPSGSGGGIFIQNTNPDQTNVLFNRIYSNTAMSGGGGIYLPGSTSNAFIEGNYIYQNSGNFGGGIGSNGTVIMQNNILYLNDATGSGGGVYFLEETSILNNTFVANSAAGAGGGILVGGTDFVISNTIVASNTASTDAGINIASANVTGDYNNIFNNGVTGGDPFSNTLTADPEFINLANYNLHLRNGSPNIDVGDPNTSPAINQDIDQEVRPYNTRVDIGADEYHPAIPNFTLTKVFEESFEPRSTTAVYTKTLENTGTISDSYTIECSNDLEPTWSVTCPAAINDLLDGELADVVVNVIIPDTPALTAGTTYITATSALSNTLIQYAQIRTIVAPNPGVQFTPNYSTTLLPGEMITFTHRITNTGDAVDTFDLQVTDNDPDWLVEILPAQPYNITLGAGASSDVKVRITVPPYAATSFTNTATIQATSRFDPTFFDSVEDTITPKATVGTRYVGVGGNDSNNNCTQSIQPCGSLSQALGQASSTDAIHVRQGTYFESSLNINGPLDISGGWNSNFSDQGDETLTIFDAQRNNRVFNIAPGDNIRPSISNLTLQNGDGGSSGGAVNVGTSSKPTFSSVTFIDNTAGRGGAINIGGGSLVRITKGQFYSNTATTTDGGAIYNGSSTIVLNQSQFFDSSAFNRGGAVYIANGTLSGANNLFANGAATNGAGLYINNGTASPFNHQTFVGNIATGDGGAIYNNNATLNVQNSIAVSNTATLGSAIYNAAGNITTNYSNFFDNRDPQFTSGGNITQTNTLSTDPLFDDAEYRLSLGSPMIDAGVAIPSIKVDFEDDFRPTDQGYDVGYDEVVGCVAKRDATLYGSIQDAIDDSAAVSNLIMVTGICRGVHTIDYNSETISQTVHLTETLTIQGGWNGDFSNRTYEPTYIDPQGRGRGLFIAGDVQPIIETITIINGNATGLQGGPGNEDAGGAIYNNDAQPTLTAVSIFSSTAQLGAAAYNHTGHATYQPIFIENNVIEVIRGQVATNTATIAGAGFYAYSGTLTLDSVEIINNDAPDGAGIYNQNAIISATNNILAVNTATNNGAGFYNISPLATNVLHNTFFNNTATSDGGGLYNNGSDLTVNSNIFDRNQATTNGPAIANSGTISVDYNYYYDNPNPVFGTVTGTNSIQSTIMPPGLTDPSNGNFHLQDDAPAVDKGDPASPVSRDFEDDPRPSDQGPDMGADETVGCIVRLNENPNLIYGSIQSAMDAANNGDTIDVAGICSGVHSYYTQFPSGGDCRGTNGYINTNLHINKNVTLRGGWDENFNARESVTILDAEGNGRVVYIAPNVTATLDQFNIIGGSLNGGNANGAGICIDNASPKILNNHIYSNTAANNGGGIYTFNSTATIDKGNRIHNNQADNGAGIYISASNIATVATIQNNFVYHNTASSLGGGLYNDGGSNRLWQNTIVGNAANTGGAIYINRHNPDIRGSLIISNTAGTTGGIHVGTGPAPTLAYNDYDQNSGNNVGGSITAIGTGSRTLDPMFTTNAYTLTFNSPVVGISDPTLALTHDFEDDIRPSHQGIDMGADEVGGCYARNTNAPSTVYGSLQLAVDLAANDDTIEFDGTCLGVNTRNNGSTDVTQNLYLSKSLTIEGNNWNFDAESPLTATLDALDLGRVVYVQNGATVTLTHMILQNGEATGAGINNNGGGIYNDGTLILDAVVMSENNANYGGAIYNTSDLTVMGSGIGPQNTAVNGAGLYNNASGGQANLTNQNVISGNIATNNGAAIYQNQGDLFLDGNKIHRNDTLVDGTIYLNGSDSISVRNNFIYKNDANTGGGVYHTAVTATIWHNTFFGNIGGGIYSTNANPNIDSNIVDSNSGAGINVPAGTIVLYNNVVSNSPNYNAGFGTPDSSNISATPDYESSGTDDYHLKSGSAGEDVGNLSLNVPNDFDNDIRPTNGGPDMGADEINTCLIRVYNASTSDYNYYGVLQTAINFAEAQSDPLPVVEIARGECRGVVSDAGVASQQVGHVTKDLSFIGSLVRANFTNANDYGNPEIGAYTTILNAEGNGRVILITNNASPTFDQLAIVRGDATQNGGDGKGGAFHNNGTGQLELKAGYVCQNTATDGAGYYGDSGSYADISGMRIGYCYPAQVVENDGGGVDSVTYPYFSGNVATNNGGGLWSNGRFDIRNVSFYSNTAAANGGGVYNTSNDNRLINATFYLNESGGDGGGLYNSGGNLGLYHNTYRNNTSTGGTGAAIFNNNAGLTLNSSIVYSNTASSGYAVDTNAGASIQYINYFDNLPDDISKAVDGTSINQDPKLAGTVLTQDSPAIDKADESLLSPGAPGTAPYENNLSIDYDRQLDERPDGDPNHTGLKRADMGSDEYFKDFGCVIHFFPSLTNDIESQVQPGDIVTYTFDLINTGHIYPQEIGQPFHGYTDTITLTLQSAIPPWASLEGGASQIFTLGWGDRVQRDLTVTVPFSATSGTQQVSDLLCESSARPERIGNGQARTNVGLTSGLQVTPIQIDTAIAGDVITYPHQVKNIGNNPALVQITPNAGPQHASADLVNITGTVITTDTSQTIFTLNEGETHDVLLRVTILDTAESGDTANPGVVATEIIAPNQPVSPLNQGAVIDEITILPSAGTRYVAATSSTDETNCKDPAQPCATIQHAIKQAVDGDDILIASGSYTDTVTRTVGAETLTQNIFIDKSVNLRGGYNVSDEFTSYEPITNATYLDGLGVNRVVFITDSITVTLSSLFIQNGRAGETNAYEGFGAGIYNHGADLTITGTWILSNTAEFGAGIYHNQNRLLLNSSVLDNNQSAPGSGGGLFAQGDDVIVENNTFANNSSSDILPSLPNGPAPQPPIGAGTNNGGAVFVATGSLTALNNIFYNSSAGTGAAIYISPSVTITNDYNIYFTEGFSDNFLGPNILTGTNSVVTDPLFIDTYYHIDSLSPAKDTGTLAGLTLLGVDYELDSRPQGIAVDIGADERLQYAGFDFTPITQTATINSGEVVTYTHLLTTTGDFADNYLLTMTHQTVGPGFTYALTPTEIFGLDTNQSVTVTLVVTGGIAGGLDTTVITATSATFLAKAVTDTTTISQTAGVDIEQSETTIGLPNQTVTYSHVLTNTGDGIDEFELSILSETPPSWNVTLTPTQTGYLLNGASIPFTVTVDIPAGTLSSTTHVVEIEANAYDPDANDILTDTTIVGPSYGLTLAPDNARTVNDGITAVYTHTLQNVGNITDTVNLSYLSTPNWTVDVQPPVVTLNPLDITEIVVSVTVPAGTGGMVHTALITATSEGTLTATAVNTTTVNIDRSVLLDPDSTIQGDAGQTVTHTHTLTNTGNVTDTYDITTSSNPGWWVSTTPGPIQLGPKMTATVTATMLIPISAVPPAQDTTIITATSQTSSTVYNRAVDTTLVGIDYGLLFVPDNSSTAPDFSVVTYTHYLTNTGNATDSYTISANNSHTWTVDFAPLSPISLNAAAGTTVVVSVTIPIGANGLVNTTTLTAISTNPSDFATVTDTTTVAGTLATISVTITPDNVGTGLPNTSVEYQHTVTNMGDVATTFALTAVSSNGWNVTIPVNNVLLNPLQSQNITLTVDIPAGIPNGTIDTLTVTARSDVDNSKFDTATDTTTVGQDGGVIINPDNTGSTDPNTTITYQHTVTNTGNGTDTFTLAAASSFGWPLVVPPPIIVDGGLSATVFVTLTVPVGTDGLVDTMTVTATSAFDSAKTDTAVNTTTVNIIGPPPNRSVIIVPDNTAVDDPGVTVTYNHLITNTGNVTEIFQLTATTDMPWATVLAPNSITLGPGTFTSIIVRVTIPPSAVAGEVAHTTVTAVSFAGTTDSATNTTTVRMQEQFVYLPVIMKNYGSTINPTPTPTPSATPTNTPIPCTPTGVDLVVTNITVQPSNPSAGQPATVFVTIRNQGTTDVAYGNNFLLDFYNNRVPGFRLVGDLQWGVQGSDMKAGSSQTFSAPFTFTGGAHQLYAQVDTDNTVNECPAENNNILGPIPLSVTGNVANEPVDNSNVPSVGNEPRNTPTPLAPVEIQPTATPTPLYTPTVTGTPEP